MKRKQQNQIIFFFPVFDLGGVEKNFLIISNFFVNNIKNFNYSLITYNKTLYLINNINNKIKIIYPFLKIPAIFRRLKFIHCLILLSIECFKFEKGVIFSFQGNFYALLIAWIFNKKIIIRSNLAPEAWSKNFLKKIIFKKLLSKSNLIIVNSSEFKKQFKKYFNVKAKKIYNPILPHKKDTNNRVKFKDNFYRKDTINLINIGRFVKQKNQAEIIKALSNVKYPSIFRLVLIGNGIEYYNLLNLVKKKKLKKFIKIINNQKKKFFYFKNADIFILSSLYEGLPNVLLEAAMLKKYIISSNCPTGPKEIIENYKYGEMYKYKSVSNLTKTLNKFDNKKTLLKKYKKKVNLKHDMFNARHNLNQYRTELLKVVSEI